MKKILVGMLLVAMCFFICNEVKAETFVEGSFINGEYINKVKDKKTYYMTMQFIKDSQGRIVYCLEPFVDFKTGQSYNEYSGDLMGYGNLTSEQKRRIELIVYYGYGYTGRLEDKWYVITQYLIWKTVDEKADIYFTNKLNGSRISKYENEINEIMSEVLRHDYVPEFVKKYEINYGDTLKIDGVIKDYIINTDYEYFNFDNDLVIEGLTNSGRIGVRRKSNYYDNNVVIYDSVSSQDLIRPGNVVNPEYFIDVDVSKGNISLDIRDDDSVYTIESDLKDTCYEIRKEEQFVDKVCTDSKPLIYKSVDLPYGDYTITQVSVGKGYRNDTKVYNVTINKMNPQVTTILYNKLIRNDIEIIKYACKDNLCGFERDAKFEIRDVKGNLVTTISTLENGYTNYTLGYGKYDIHQVSGLKNYTVADDYSEKIVDESSIHKKELYNYYIENDEVVLEPEDSSEEIILPPRTSVDFSLELGYLSILFTLILGIKKMYF